VVVPARKFIREGSLRTSCFLKKKKKEYVDPFCFVPAYILKNKQCRGKSRHSSEVIVVSTSSSSEILVERSSPDFNSKQLRTSVSLRKLPREPEESASRSAPNLPVPTRSTSVSDLTPLRWSTHVGNAGRVPHFSLPLPPKTEETHDPFLPGALPMCKIYLCNDIIIIAHGKDKSKAIAPKLVTTWVKHTDGTLPSLPLPPKTN